MKLDDAVHELSEKLGEDTLNLKLRVGIHSGSITAGILRGEKSRFQVFGGTLSKVLLLLVSSQRHLRDTHS